MDVYIDEFAIIFALQIGKDRFDVAVDSLMREFGWGEREVATTHTVNLFHLRLLLHFELYYTCLPYKKLMDRMGMMI